MDNGVDFLFTGGGVYPGKRIRILAVQFSLKRDYIPRGKQVDFEPPTVGSETSTANQWCLNAAESALERLVPTNPKAPVIRMFIMVDD